VPSFVLQSIYCVLPRVSVHFIPFFELVPNWQPFSSKSTYNVIMPFDPEGDLYTAEPKLLSIDCFPIVFTRPAPPDYTLIMAANTRYHRVPEERPSIESSTGHEDLDVLLIDPNRNDEEDMPPKKEHRFTCHPTFFFRLISVCVFIPSFVLLIVGNRRRSIPAIVFICFALIRNALVVLHHIFSQLIRLEFRNRSPKPKNCSKNWPGWTKYRRLHLLLDIVLLIVLLVTSILATRAPERYRWYNGERTPEVTAGCILAFVGM
jgi:hypothetical protein